MHLLVMKSLHRQSWRKKKKKKSPHSTGVGKAETLVRKDFHVNDKPPIQSISGERQIILCSLTVVLRSYPWHGKNNKDLCLPAVPLHCIQDQALFPFSLKAKQNLDITCMQNIPLFFFFGPCFLSHVQLQKESLCCLATPALHQHFSIPSPAFMSIHFTFKMFSRKWEWIKTVAVSRFIHCIDCSGDEWE